ncbi:MAG: MFS transporter [Rhodoferax sp.]|nr:MFS transporter [Rhodoferax sp.]
MKIFYGWRMAGAACGIQFMFSALLNQAFGAYVAVLSDERGWSKTALSGAAALQSVESAIMGPLLGWFMDRFGPQNMIRAGVIIFAGGFFALSRIETIGDFYLCAVLLAIGASLGGYFPLTVALIQWFERHRARALSVMSMGLALGGLALPAIAWSIHLYGWRATAFASGIIALVVGLPLATVIRRRPQDHGETVDGLPRAAPSAVEAAPGAPVVQTEFTVAQALRTRAFWLLALGHAFALLVVTSVNVHGISHMKEGLGYTVQQASLVVMLLTFGQIGGVLLGFGIGDRFEKRYVAALCMLGHTIGLLLLTYARTPWEVAAFAIVHGVAWGLRGPFMQAIRADYFGRNAIGMILGLSAVIIALGQIAGPLVAGVFADLTGNYRLGFTILALVAGAGSVLFLLAVKPTGTTGA